VYQLLDATVIERNISTVVESSEPIPENVLRAIGSLEPEEQRVAWVDAKRMAAGGKVTSVHTKAAKAKIVEKKKESEPSARMLKSAFERITEVSGKAFAAEVRGTLRPDDTVTLSKMLDDEMLRVKKLMVAGWSFKEAYKEVKEQLTPDAPLRELLSRAVKGGGVYRAEIANFTIATAGGDAKADLESRLKGWPPKPS
jgi:hypothetical protein